MQIKKQTIFVFSKRIGEMPCSENELRANSSASIQIPFADNFKMLTLEVLPAFLFLIQPKSILSNN
jgi:hypothetical protein